MWGQKKLDIFVLQSIEDHIFFSFCEASVYLSAPSMYIVQPYYKSYKIEPYYRVYSNTLYLSYEKIIMYCC